MKRLTHVSLICIYVSLMSHSGAEPIDFNESCVLLNVEQARTHVGSNIGCTAVPRATFYRWCQALNLTSPFSLNAVYALTIFGRNVRIFRDYEVSVNNTIKVLEEKGL